jgi:hypothetical protein
MELSPFLSLVDGSSEQKRRNVNQKSILMDTTNGAVKVFNDRTSINCTVQTKNFSTGFDVNIMTNTGVIVDKQYFNIKGNMGRLNATQSICHFKLKFGVSCQTMKCTYFTVFASWFNEESSVTFVLSVPLVVFSKYNISANQINSEVCSFLSLCSFQGRFSNCLSFLVDNFDEIHRHVCRENMYSFLVYQNHSATFTSSRVIHDAIEGISQNQWINFASDISTSYSYFCILKQTACQNEHQILQLTTTLLFEATEPVILVFTLGHARSIGQLSKKK